MLLLLIACSDKPETQESTPPDDSAVDSTDDSADDSAPDDSAPDDSVPDTGPCQAPTFAGATPLVWYSLEDAGAATVADGAGTSPGTAVSVVGTPGKVGQAGDFQVGSIQSTPTAPTEAFTWAGWVRPDARSSELTILANQGNGPTSYTGWLFGLEATGRPILYTEAGSGNEYATTAVDPLELGAWTHLAFTFQTSTAAVYVNGVKVGEQYLPYTAIISSTNPYMLGKDANTGGRHFDGALDEVGLWGSALSEAEIAALVVDGECGISALGL